MQDPCEEVGISRRQCVCEEVAADDLAPVGDPCLLENVMCLREDVRKIEKHAVEMRVGSEHRGDRRPAAAADVGYPGFAAPVDREKSLDAQVRAGCHRPIEDRARVGMLGEMSSARRLPPE